MTSNRAIFLDRDGTINVRNPGGYVTCIQNFQWLPGALDGIRLANRLGYKVIVISNQGGPIAKGLCQLSEVYALHQGVRGAAYRHGAIIDKIYFCPHHPKGTVAEFARECGCRKPKPGLLLRAIRVWRIDPARSLMVGDEESDLQAGAAAGVTSILIQPGQRLDHLLEAALKPR